jgi:hypothetical protein
VRELELLLEPRLPRSITIASASPAAIVPPRAGGARILSRTGWSSAIRWYMSGWVNIGSSASLCP